jgi:hypothetical protein
MPVDEFHRQVAVIALGASAGHGFALAGGNALIAHGVAEWIVTAPGGEQMMLQMAYFDRCRSPVITDLGPILDLEDVVGGKVCALASRAYERDYADTAAALDHYSVDQLIAFARRLDPGLTDVDFADAGRRLDNLSDSRFIAFGLGPQDVADLRQRFAGWPRLAPPRQMTLGKQAPAGQ